jgi:hypothetical protein
MRHSSIPTKFFVLLAIFAVIFAATPIVASAQMSAGLAVYFAPPALPVYEQPPCPTQNYIWSPGYWAYDNGYYWVPGTWVPAPQPGLLWTPGYWGWDDGYFIWHSGYWATQIGFYGGVNYGFGYYGNGYVGGSWQGNQFRYNTAVSNIDRNRIRNVYSSRSGVRNSANRVSYNGGRGGVTAQPTQGQLAVEDRNHIAPTSVQTQHERVAATSRANFSSVNHGRPATSAVARPLGSTTPQQHKAAPAVQQHKAAPAAQQRQAAPQQQRQAAPQQRRQAAPQQQRQAAPQQQRQAAPQQRQAAPQQQRQAAPQQQRQAAPDQRQHG